MSVTLLACECGSELWTVTSRFSVGQTVPTVAQKGYIAVDVAHPEREPKCEACGKKMPTFTHLMAQKKYRP